MRDKKRIAKIVKLLEEAWNIVPDWRLGQLISNMLGVGHQDVFHPEDEDWEALFKNFIRFYKSGRNNLL